MTSPIIHVIILVIAPQVALATEDNVLSSCEEAMFMSSETVKLKKAARLACLAQHALQRNWFPDPIAGLFTYQTWNGMDGFWQDGIAIETMANAMHYGNHTRYFSVVKVIFIYTCRAALPLRQFY